MRTSYPGEKAADKAAREAPPGHAPIAARWSMAVTTEWSDWRNGWMWWIQSVYVHPEHRRTGIFRALYEHVEKLARDDPSVMGLRLYVEHENESAQQTYQRMGMRRTGYLVMEKYPL